MPGAGNTWVRLLIEKGSALRTGSVFGDGFIKRMGMAVRDPEDIFRAEVPHTSHSLMR